MSDNDIFDLDQYICPECHTGYFQRDFVTYFTWLAEALITVPDFPAWVCDVCGRREYDGAAIAQLNILLNPAMGKTSRPNNPKPKTPPQPPIQI